MKVYGVEKVWLILRIADVFSDAIEPSTRYLA